MFAQIRRCVRWVCWAEFSGFCLTPRSRITTKNKNWADNTQAHGWYFQAADHSARPNDSIARVMPQPGHQMPVVARNGQVAGPPSDGCHTAASPKPAKVAATGQPRRTTSFHGGGEAIRDD